MFLVAQVFQEMMGCLGSVFLNSFKAFAPNWEHWDFGGLCITLNCSCTRKAVWWARAALKLKYCKSHNLDWGWAMDLTWRATCFAAWRYYLLFIVFGKKNLNFCGVSDSQCYEWLYCVRPKVGLWWLVGCLGKSGRIEETHDKLLGSSERLLGWYLFNSDSFSP